jgi:branched-subunit amino acid ABC-type transport system permease component
MDSQIMLFLTQDGLMTGAIYALLALAIVLVFTVTRVIFVPQGEFVALGALTLASLQSGHVPGTLWLLYGLSATAFISDAIITIRGRQFGRLFQASMRYLLIPALLGALTWWLAPLKLALVWQVLLTLALVVPAGPLLYRIAFRPLAQAPVLVLLIVSVAAQLVLTGLSLIFFGPEGSRTPAFSESKFNLGGMEVSGQSLWVVGTCAGLIAVLFLFFRYNFYGKALLATAVNRKGALLMGISPTMAGSAAFTVAAFIGALSGILIGSVTTISYDTGFLIGLKGFVAAIIGGLASYPLAAFGAVLVGLLESYSSFSASSFKEVIVFALIIPVLLWRSLRTHEVEEDE